MCASSGSAYRSVVSKTKWPTTYTQYFELGMQLSPALQSLFSFHLGCGYARKKTSKKKTNKKQESIWKIFSYNTSTFQNQPLASLFAQKGTPGDEVVSDVPSGVVFSSWLGTSTEREREHTFIRLSHILPISADGKSIHTYMNVQKQRLRCPNLLFCKADL